MIQGTQPNRACDLSAFSFSPKRGKWLICNQTGERVSRKSVKRKRRTLDRKSLRKINPQPKPSGLTVVSSSQRDNLPNLSHLPQAPRDDMGDAKCPYCRNWNFNVSLDRRRCFACGKIFIVVSASSPINYYL